MTSSITAATAGGATDAMAGLSVMDLSASKRLPVLMTMVEALSRATGAQEVLREFAEGFERLFGPRGYVSLSTRGLEPGQYKITRLITHDMAEEMASADPWRAWSKMPVQRGGIFGRIVAHGAPVVIHHLDLANDPVVGDALAMYRSLMAIPLYDDGRLLNWAITLRESPEGFTIEELEESILRTNLGGAAVKNALMNRELREAHEALQYEAEQVARIQRSLLPEIPEIPGLKIGASYETFGQAGGDMYVLRPLRPLDQEKAAGGACCDPCGPWGILIADVSGHGTPAAVVMAMVRAIIDAYPNEPSGPAEVLEYINRQLFVKRIEDRFVTAFFAIYDPATRRLTYSRAGHNPPVWMCPSSGSGWEMRRLDANGDLPLGIIEETTYHETTIMLQPGQSLVLYTDGITEAHSPSGEMFGVEGIESSLVECTGQPECAISHITGRLKGHEADVRPTDDQTLIVLHVDREADCPAAK
ncbi:MAG: PP2C family protein-serine/threonine phosphatase [Planctomycetota bacterium]|jgi:sigma-B regulation protein RsbU (phosphoserine phosphatase)